MPRLEPPRHSPMKPLTRDQVREIDRRAVADYGLPGIVLMENAGRGVAELLHAAAPEAVVAIACGKGNNAGDGFVIARHLENLGHDVRLLLACDPAGYRGDAATAWQVAARSGIPAGRWPSRKGRRPGSPVQASAGRSGLTTATVWRAISRASIASCLV